MRPSLPAAGWPPAMTKRWRACQDASPSPSPRLPSQISTNTSYFWIRVLTVPNSRRELSERMGVSLSGEVYASPLHRQPIFADLDRDSFPVADDVCARHICLPVHSDMTDDEADYVVESLASVLAGRTMEEAAKS